MPIEIKHLTHTYSEGGPFEATALHDISFRIEDGDFVAVVGHTGSGKSTLVQHLNGLLKPTEGTILVDDEDVNGDKARRKRVRQKVGLVFQYPEYQLFEETVAKDIAFGPKNQGIPADEIDRRVRKAMADVSLDYDSIAEKSPFELSGGQMRRVAIAGVLAMQPKILILDEPTAGLDPKGRDDILRMITDLHRSSGVTVLMVSHSMDDVARVASHMLVLSKGRFVALDTPRNIFRQREMMESIGLGVPEGAQLSSVLREAGVDLPDDIYTLDELHDAILSCWKERSL